MYYIFRIMNYCAIKSPDIANGKGVRVSLFVAGCTHHCPGCFNSETWDFNAGELFDDKVIDDILERLSPSYIEGLSLLGGEPFEPANQLGLLPLIRRFRERFPEKDIWAYTGYLYDRDLLPGGRAYCEATDEILDAIHILIDGPFVEALKDPSLAFRGSSNQRILDLSKLRMHGRPCAIGAEQVG